VLLGLQNVPIHYVIVLREAGAAYYIASLEGVRGAATYPRMRPVAIDAADTHDPLHPAVHQGVLGEIGFSADTVVSGVSAADVPELARWYGTAQAADRLVGDGRALAGSAAETGGRWRGCEGTLVRTPEGLAGGGPGDNSAVLLAPEPSGLIHAVVELTEAAEVALLWRGMDERNHWRVSLRGEECLVSCRRAGAVVSSHRARRARTRATTETTAVQILDDGLHVMIYADGAPLLGAPLTDGTHRQGTGLGIAIGDPAGRARIRDLEAHPREVEVPPQLLLCPDRLERGSRPVLRERFDRGHGDLAGYRGPDGHAWRRQMGGGSFVLDGHGGVQVAASLSRPLRSRTAYTVDWETHDSADVAAEILPPGTGRGEGHRGRAGLIFWQDAKNYVIVNNWLDDSYRGASVSAFYCLRGFEDLFDSVWTNVGRRIRWGTVYQLRVIFDGDRFLAMVDDEPVLSRALRDIYPGCARLAIRRIGMVANWEWGHDTGSRFLSFTARTRERAA
jgi:hypothetical protein